MFRAGRQFESYIFALAIRPYTAEPNVVLVCQQETKTPTLCLINDSEETVAHTYLCETHH